MSTRARGRIEIRGKPTEEVLPCEQGRRELPVISVLLVTAIVLLYENGGVPLGLLLPLTTLVAPVRLLDHPGGMIKLPLFTVRQRQPAEVRLVAVAVGHASRRDRARDPGADHAVELALAAAVRRVVLAAVAVAAVQLQLQLQELAEVGGGGRRGRRVRGQAATRRTRGTSLGVGVRNRRGSPAAVAVRVEQFSGVEGL